MCRGLITTLIAISILFFAILPIIISIYGFYIMSFSVEHHLPGYYTILGFGIIVGSVLAIILSCQIIIPYLVEKL